MHRQWVVAALGLVNSALAVDKYVPSHRRFTYHPNINDFNYLSILSKRDECSDALGGDATNSNCAPDDTLCCTTSGESFPSCEKWINRGWCCFGEGEDDECFLDQVSSCGDDGAVSCSNLAEGTDEACCPSGTKCDDSEPQPSDAVRCIVNRDELIKADKALHSSTTEAATSTTEAATSTSATSTHTPSETGTHKPVKGEMSAGAIGGIATGVVAAVAGVTGIVLWLLRRRTNRGKYYPAGQLPQPMLQDAHELRTQAWEQTQGFQSPAAPAAPYGSSSPPYDGATPYDKIGHGVSTVPNMPHQYAYGQMHGADAFMPVVHEAPATMDPEPSELAGSMSRPSVAELPPSSR